MKNEKEIIEKYNNLVNYLTKVVKNSEDSELVRNSRISATKFINLLYKYEQKDKSVYEQMLSEISVDKSELTVEVEKLDNSETKKNETSCEEYVNSEILNSKDSNLKEEFERLMDKLEEDLKLPNDKLIETWMKNYRDFILNYGLDEKQMIDFMISKFEVYDEENIYSAEELKEMYENIETKTENDIKSEEENKPNEEEKKEEENKPSEEETKEEENKPSEEEKKEEENKPSEEEKKEEENKPSEEEKKEEKNKPSEEETKEENKPDEQIVNNKKVVPLKIKSVKKQTLSKTEKLGLTATGLAILSTPALFSAMFTTFLPITASVGLGYGIYRLIKNRHYNNNTLYNYLKENGFAIDSNNNLIQRTVSEDGKTVEKTITEESVGKEQYENIKKNLMKIGAMENKLINIEYMKNKLASLLLKSDTVKNVYNKYKEHKKNKKIQKTMLENTTDYMEIMDIKKGGRTL